MAEGLSILVTRLGLRPGRAIALGTAIIILLSAIEREEDHPYFIWGGHGCVTQVRDLASLRFLALKQSYCCRYSGCVSSVVGHLLYAGRKHDTSVARGLFGNASHQALFGSGPIDEFAADRRTPTLGPIEMRFGRMASFSVVPADMPQITDISNPNGVEVVGGGQFVWVGPDPLSLKVVVPRKGRYIVSAAQCVPGPSLPGKLARAVKVDLGSNSFTMELVLMPQVFP